MISKKLLIQKFLIASIFIALLIGYFYNQVYFTGRSPWPTGDEPDYLVGAMQIKEYGGPSKFLSYLLSGNYTETRKHPLFMLVLSPFAKMSLDFFVSAKFVNLAIGVFLFIISFFVLKKLFSLASAFYFIVTLTLNEYLLRQTALVVPDTLMVLLVLLSSYFYIKGFNEKAKKYLTLGSFFAALSFLNKPNGILIVIVFAIFSIWHLRFKVFKSKLVWTSAISFIIFASPIFIRNIVLFKNPLYNNNVSLLWVDNRQERRSPDFLTRPPSPVEYLEQRGFVNEIKLYGENVVKMLSNVSILVLFGAWNLRYSVPLFLFLFLAIYFDKDKVRKKYLFVQFLVFYTFFAYTFKISPHFRHVMPMIFIFIGYLGFYFEKILHLIFKAKYKAVTIVLALFVSVYVVLYLHNEKRLFKTNLAEGQVDILDSSTALRDWSLNTIKEGEVFIKGKDDRYLFEWYSDIKGTRLTQPYFASFEEFANYLKKENVKYLILTGPIVNSFPEIFEKYFIQEGSGNSKVVKIVKIPATWEIVETFPRYNPQNSEYKFIIFQFN